jgi:hypothetical protein
MLDRLTAGARQSARMSLHALIALRAHPAWATGLAWAALLLARLYLGGAVGLADNFDGHRLMCQLGVVPHPIPADQPLWAFLTPRYDAYTWYGESCSAGGSGQPYLTTAVLPLWIAKFLTATVGNHVLGMPGVLDLRLLGLVYIAVAAAAIGWCVHELPGRPWARVLLASAIGLAVSDSAFALDFISPLSDPAGLVGLLLLVPALLRLLRVDRPTWRELAAIAAVTVWTIGAKTQLSSLLVAVVPCLLVRPTAVPRLLRPLARRRTAAALFGRAPAAALCAGLVVFTAGFQQLQPRWLNEIVLYDAYFGELLGHSHHVQADLKALHLDPGAAASAGSNIVAPNSLAATPLYAEYLQNASFGEEVGFYAVHPWRLLGLTGRGLAGMAAARPSYLGDYLAGSGHPPYAKDCRVCVVEAAFTLAEPLRWVVYPGLWGASIVAGLLLAVRRRGNAAARSSGGTLAALSAVTVLQFYLVMLSDGESDLQKHMIFTDFGTCLLGPLAIAAVIGLDLATQTQTQPLPEPKPVSKPGPEPDPESLREPLADPEPEPASLPRQPDPAGEDSAVRAERRAR